MKVNMVCCVAVASAIVSGLAQGSIVGSGGATSNIAPPASAVLGALESNTLSWAFNEATTLTLASGLLVNATTPGTYTSNGSLTPGVIPAGTVINSHYLYTDPVGGTTWTYEGFVEFDQPILGVILLRPDLNSSDYVGAPGTLYGDNQARGLELSQAERFVITIVGNRINYRFVTSTATDDIRVITAVPAPGGLALVGLGGLLAARRRRV